MPQAERSKTRYRCRPRSSGRKRTLYSSPTLFANQDRSDSANAWAVISHAWLGADCDGCLVANDRGPNLEIFCNRCGQVVRTFSNDEDPVLDLVISYGEFCPWCHGTLLPRFDEEQGFVCRSCARHIDPAKKSPAGERPKRPKG